MHDPVFSGVGVALVTLFDEHLALDASQTADLAAKLVEAGVTGVVVAGTTGEAAALDGRERAALVTAIKAVLPSTIPVLCGIGGPSTYQALAYLDHAVGAGADALLALSLPGGADQTAYYETLSAKAGSTPLLAYHYPGASAPGIPIEVLATLPVWGVKDSSGDAERLLETKATFDEPIYTGSPALLTLAGESGCAGAILAIANVLPEISIAAFDGDAKAQASLSDAIRRSRAPFPAAIKALTAERFNTPAYRRMG